MPIELDTTYKSPCASHARGFPSAASTLALWPAASIQTSVPLPGNCSLELADNFHFDDMEMHHLCCTTEDQEGEHTAVMIAKCIPSPSCCFPTFPSESEKEVRLRDAPTAPAISEAAKHPPFQSPISAGTLLVLAIDPCATLEPIMAADASMERRVRALEGGSRRYLAFARHVEYPGSAKEQVNPGERRKRKSISLVPEIEPSGSSRETVRNAHLQLSLLHHKPPKRSRYDSIDESMCVPLEWNGQHRRGQHVISQHSPLRSTFRNQRAPLRIDGATDAMIPASCRELYAHTTVGVIATMGLSDSEAKDSPHSTLSLSEQEMQRFDAYQIADRLREEEECEDEATSESGEADEDCELSTVISGLSMTSMGGVRLHMAGGPWDPPLLSPTTVESKGTHDELETSDSSNSTQPTTLPSYNPSRDDHEQLTQERGTPHLEPWSVGRQCTLHVRVWFDIDSALRHGKPSDPRVLLEDLRQLQTLERAANMHATSQVRQFAAARVAAWRENPISHSSDHISWPNPTSSPNSTLKSIKRAWKKLTCRAK